MGPAWKVKAALGKAEPSLLGHAKPAVPKISPGSQSAFPYKMVAAQEEAAGELTLMIIDTEESMPSGH